MVYVRDWVHHAEKVTSPKGPNLTNNSKLRKNVLNGTSRSSQDKNKPSVSTMERYINACQRRATFRPRHLHHDDDSSVLDDVCKHEEVTLAIVKAVYELNPEAAKYAASALRNSYASRDTVEFLI
jgi:hypothetical protein